MKLSKLEIPREKCWALVKKYVDTDIQKHLLATEAAMTNLATYFGEDEHTWAMCGLLHDIDVQQITPKNQYDQHMIEHCGEKCKQFLQEIFFPADLIRAIQSHNDIQKIPRDSNLAKALFAVDGLTGFIIAVTKIYPDKKLASVKMKSVIKRMKENRFAAAVNRDNIRTCETELGISLEKFIEIVMEAMKKIAPELGV